ncbi:MAG: helix-turn-helix domain-containing protein [Ferruginibacter sp.]
MSNTKNDRHKTPEACSKAIIPVRDALDILSGKWKLPIIISLSFGNKRFSEMAKQIPGITDKMLSKELREMEMNELVKRTVYDAVPVVVEYSMTPYGKTLEPLIDELQKWGAKHRKRIIHK